MSVNTKMTALADEIRELSGTTGKLGLDAMTNHVNGANVEIENQEDLLAQIATALEGKAEAIPTLQSKTATPSTVEQVITPDANYDGLSSVIVNGDINLVAENIVSGVSIFGIEGNAEIGGSIESGTYNLVVTFGDYVTYCDVIYYTNGEYTVKRNNLDFPVTNGSTVTFENIDANELLIISGSGFSNDLRFIYPDNFKYIPRNVSADTYYFFKGIPNSTITLHIYSVD